MAECSQCGSQVDLGYTCNECGSTFCSDHRLPESHRCSGLRKDESETVIGSAGQEWSPSGTQERTGENLGVVGYILLPFVVIYTVLKALIWNPFTPIIVFLGVFGLGATWLISSPAMLPDAPDVDVPDVPDVQPPDIDSSGDSSTSGDSSQSSDRQSAVSDESTGDRTVEVASLVHARVNEERTSRGLRQLEYSTSIAEVAVYHSEDMAARDYFSHDSPDGETVQDRYDRYGISCAGGENIFHISYDGVSYSNEELADATVDSWLNSPGHRENMLSDRWREEGIGVEIVERDGNTHVYVTQNFC